MHNRDREQDVLRAAREVFLEKGFAQATTAEIAARAQVAEGTIYRVAPNKRALLERVIVKWYAGIIDALREQLATAPDTQTRLQRFVRHQFTIFTDHAPIARLLVRELRASADYRRSALHQANRTYTSLFTDLISSGQRAGDLRTDISTALLRDIFFGTIEHATLAGPDLKRREAREAEFFAMFWAMVCLHD